MLTKSDYLRYIQCQKCLWLSKHRKDLVAEVSETQQAVFDQGYEVENYARKLFKKGVEVEGFYEVAKKHTKELVKRGEKVIYQATALTEEISAMADILVFNSKSKKWDIYEVKSSTQIKDDVHIPDLCFQKIAFEEDGFEIGKTYLVLVNNEYVRKGDIDPKEFLIIEDISDEVENMRSTVMANIPKAIKFMAQKEEPEVRILKQCKKPYECAFMAHCLGDIATNSIYKLQRTPEKKLKDLQDMGILKINEIPEDFPLTDKQQNQVMVNKTGKPIVDKEMIEATLKNLSYPLYCLDYETYGSAIPLFDGTKPYQQVCFQYSLHVLRGPNDKLEHYEYLQTESSNPVEPLLRSMKKDIGDGGTVIVWNKGFEMSRNNEMGEMYPKYKKFLESVNERVFDLMEIFTQQWYVHADFQGSCSIKKVLPVIVPKLSYNDLEGIQEGLTASLHWYKHIHLNSQEKEKTIRNMIEYCKLDTYAMVEIFRELLKL